MRWAILGTMLITDDAGTEIPLPEGRVRVVAAVLVMRANRVVPTGELAELVWDGAPPAAAARTVQVYVGRLRRALGPSLAARIITRAPGYLCRAGEDELDILRFEKLCGQARLAAREGAWPAAAGLWAEALGLWRGEPLADIRSDLLRGRELPRLEQLHMQAVEDHIDTQLHLDRHEHLIPQLQDLTRHHPLREHLHAQLMRALARAGRRAEALKAYRDARQVLADELGIEPGPELGELHKKVLAGAAEPGAPGLKPPPGRGQAPVPRQLPAAAGQFTGRRAELEVLNGLLTPHAPGGTVVISAIDGMPGVGKTALAVHAAHRLSERFPDGQLFIDLHGYTRGYPPRSAGDALDYFLRSLGVPPQQIPQDLEERAGLYRQRLVGSQTLILLDNAISEAQIRPLLPAATGCLVLVTSRRRLKALDDAHVLPLDVLPGGDAADLFRAVAGPERVPVDDPFLKHITDLCAGLPLALRIAASLLRHRPAWTLRHLATLLSGQQQRVTALSDGERDLGAVFDLSYAHLTAGQRNLFDHLGLVPGPDIDAYAAAALTDTGLPAGQRLLEDLIDQNLLIEHAPGRYRLHDLLCLYSRARAERVPAEQRDRTLGQLLDYLDTAQAVDHHLTRRAAPDLPRSYAEDKTDPEDSDQEWHSALTRLLDHYLHTAAIAMDTLFPAEQHRRPRATATGAAIAPVTTPALARAWLDAEQVNLVAAGRYATDHGWHSHSVRLAATVYRYLSVGGHSAEAITMHSHARQAARNIGDTGAEATALINLGLAHWWQARWEQATRCYQHALTLYQRDSDRPGQARAHSSLALVEIQQGRYQPGSEHVRQALRLYQSIGDRIGAARALCSLGDIDIQLGNRRRARRHLQQAVALHHAAGDPIGEARALGHLGVVDLQQGRFEMARLRTGHALTLCRENGDRIGEGRGLARLGDIELGQHHFRPAIDYYQQALTACRESGDRSGEAAILSGLGTAFLAARQPDDAHRHWQQALVLYTSLRAPEADIIRAQLTVGF
jgi:DNA-binding SARP family transcriptional activator